MGAALPDLSQKLILLWYGGPHSGGKMPLECYMQHVFTFFKKTLQTLGKGEPITYLVANKNF